MVLCQLQSYYRGQIVRSIRGFGHLDHIHMMQFNQCSKFTCLLCTVILTLYVNSLQYVLSVFIHGLLILGNILCGLLTIEHTWTRGHATSSVTAVLPPLGQCCGTVSLNIYGNRTSPSDNSNDC